MSERDELARELFIGDNFNQPREASIDDWQWLLDRHRSSSHIEHYFTMADTVLALGYHKEPK